METAIKLAIEGGWILDKHIGETHTTWGCTAKHTWIRFVERNSVKDRWDEEMNYRNHSDTLLDPLFWKALGKVLHQGDFKNEENGKGSWKSNWHMFIDHLASGGDAETFFNNILSK